MDIILDSAKTATGALRNIPRSPRLPKGVPAGHYEAEAARPNLTRSASKVSLR